MMTYRATLIKVKVMIRKHPRSYSFARSAEITDKNVDRRVECWTDQSCVAPADRCSGQGFVTMAGKKLKHVAVLIDEGDAHLHL